VDESEQRHPEGERRQQPSRALDPLQGRWTIAHKDDLTGLYNRRLLSELFEESWGAVVENHPELSLIMVDLDGFKAVNDRYGHPSGDRVLVDTAGLLRRHFREEDLIVRYGGDEFVVLAPGAGPERASDLAARARQAMSRFPFQDADGRPIEAPLSFSLGVASLPADGPSAEGLLAAADRRLYRDKRSRRLRRPPRALLLAAALAAGLGAAFVAFALRWEAPRFEAPDPVSTPASPSALESAVEASAGDSSRLAAQLLELEQTVAALRDELERERARRPSGGSSEAIESLEEQVRSLQAELESRAAQAPEPAPPSAQPPTPTPRPPPKLELAPSPSPAAPASEAKTAPVFERPRLVHLDKPPFPREAATLRDPVVRVLVTIDEGGKVVSARNLPPLVGYGLDVAARRAAQNARFEPGTRDGVPIQTSAILAIRFVQR